MAAAVGSGVCVLLWSLGGVGVVSGIRGRTLLYTSTKFTPTRTSHAHDGLRRYEHTEVESTLCVGRGEVEKERERSRERERERERRGRAHTVQRGLRGQSLSNSFYYFGPLELKFRVFTKTLAQINTT